MKFAVCIDNPAEIRLIEEYLQHNLYQNDEFDFFNTTDKLIKNIDTIDMRYAIYFISIELEERKGLLLAKKIRERDLSALIIFISDNSSQIASVFDVYTFDYIVRPLNEEKLTNVMQRAKHYIDTTNTYFDFSFNRKTIVLLMEEIVCVSKSGRVAYIHTADKTFKTYLKMSEVLSKLNKKYFVKIHGSYVVNLNYVLEIMKNEVIIKPTENAELCENTSLPLSRKFKEELKKNYLQFLKYG